MFSYIRYFVIHFFSTIDWHVYVCEHIVGFIMFKQKESVPIFMQIDVMVSSRLYRRKNVEVTYNEIVRRLSSPERMASEDVCRYLQRPLNQSSHVDSIRRGKKRVEDGQFSAFSLLLEGEQKEQYFV